MKNIIASILLSVTLIGCAQTVPNENKETLSTQVNKINTQGSIDELSAARGVNINVNAVQYPNDKFVPTLDKRK